MGAIDYMNPVRLFRNYVRQPVEAFLLHQYVEYKRRTSEGINSFREVLYRAGIISVFVTAILWLSVFMYVVFYYTYMPNVAHVRAVHLQFKSCEEPGGGGGAGAAGAARGACSFPAGHVQLTRRSRVLMSAQPYRVRLLLDMPESQVNKDIGMFMVCAQMRAKGGVLVSSSCRSTMLRHRSELHQLIRTIVFAPLLLAGFNEEKQQVQVELFSDFEDDEDIPVTDAYIELQSRSAQVYSCELQMEAHFSGLRYVMYNWPRLSAAIGISTNLFFVALIFILSWYHLQDGLPEFMKNKSVNEYLHDNEKDTKPAGKVKLEREDSNSFLDDDNFLEDLQMSTKEEKTFEN